MTTRSDTASYSAYPSLSLKALRNASRVVGGGDAGFGRFPWMALVRGTHTRYVSPICR